MILYLLSYFFIDSKEDSNININVNNKDNNIHNQFNNLNKMISTINNEIEKLKDKIPTSIINEHISNNIKEQMTTTNI